MANQQQYYIKGIIDRFENGLAVIKTEDGQTLNWPKENLPQNCVAGQEVKILLKTSNNDQSEREELAKTILNQLLKTTT